MPLSRRTTSAKIDTRCRSVFFDAASDRRCRFEHSSLALERERRIPMKLYYFKNSRSTRPHWMIGEVGARCEIIPVDLTAGEQRKPDFLG
ncbi:MAG: hypothetical protein ACREQ9_08425, partial [Candidatus Binatia bacterium]